MNSKLRFSGLFLVVSIIGLSLVACSSQPVKQKPSDAEFNALLTQSLVAFDRDRLTIASRAINQALQQKPNSADANNIAGLIYARANRPIDAERFFKKALSIAPQDPSTLNNYGNFACNQGDLELAESLFNRAISNRKNPQPEVAHTNAGLCSLRASNLDQAAMHLRAAIAKKEDNPTALYHLAQINLDKNRPAPALKRLDDYAKYAPHSPKTLWLGVQIGRLMSNPELELRYRNMLAQQFPDSEEYRLMLKR